MTIFTDGAPFRGTSIFGTTGHLRNTGDGCPATPARSTGKVLLDPVGGAPNVGQEWTIQSWSVSFIMTCTPGGLVGGFSNVWAQMPKIYAGLVKGGAPTPDPMTGDSLYITSPIPADTSNIDVIWDGTTEDAPPYFIGTGLIPFPTLVRSHTFQIQSPLDYDTSVPLFMGIWIPPAIYSPGTTIAINDAKYSILYQRQTAGLG